MFTCAPVFKNVLLPVYRYASTFNSHTDFCTMQVGNKQHWGSVAVIIASVCTEWEKEYGWGSGWGDVGCLMLFFFVSCFPLFCFPLSFFCILQFHWRLRMPDNWSARFQTWAELLWLVTHKTGKVLPVCYDLGFVVDMKMKGQQALVM